MKTNNKFWFMFIATSTLLLFDGVWLIKQQAKLTAVSELCVKNQENIHRSLEALEGHTDNIGGILTVLDLHQQSIDVISTTLSVAKALGISEPNESDIWMSAEWRDTNDIVWDDDLILWEATAPPALSICFSDVANVTLSYEEPNSLICDSTEEDWLNVLYRWLAGKKAEGDVRIFFKEPEPLADK